MAHACVRAQGIFFFVCNRWSATITEDRPRQFLFSTDLVLYPYELWTSPMPRAAAESPLLAPADQSPHTIRTTPARPRTVICHVVNFQAMDSDQEAQPYSTKHPPVYPAISTRWSIFRNNPQKRPPTLSRGPVWRKRDINPSRRVTD